ncbi:MAG: AAA family ATPase [Myxococcales bacterium]|nr:AAA family ATPase [Myxococcales bacterium]
MRDPHEERASIPHPQGDGPPGDGSGPPGGAPVAELTVADPETLRKALGPQDRNLRHVAAAFGVVAGSRGDRIQIQGAEEPVARARRCLLQLLELAATSAPVRAQEVEQAVALVEGGEEVRLRDLHADVVVVAAGRRPVTPRGVNQQRYVEALRTHDLVFAIGPAGTGKTYLAMAQAIAAFQARRYQRIVLTRPAVEAGERLGFLPGDLVEKVNPYLRPLYDALHDMLGLEKTQELIARGFVEVAPLAFMRGRTLNNSFVILDEAQNTTHEQMKMFLTRLGFGSQAVVTGDVTQIDLPPGVRSGLVEARELLAEVPGIRVCTFTEKDVVRHPLVQKIILAYDGARSNGAPRNGRREEESR